MVDRNKIISIAENLLKLTFNYSKKELPKVVDDFLIELPGGEDWRQK